LSGAGVDDAKPAFTDLFWVLAALFVTALLVFAAFLPLLVFLAGALLAAVFFVAFFAVFFAPAFFAPALADFLVDFFAATLRDRAFAALFFFEALAPLFRVPLAFLLPFLAAMFRPLLPF